MEPSPSEYKTFGTLASCGLFVWFIILGACQILYRTGIVTSNEALVVGLCAITAFLAFLNNALAQEARASVNR